MDSPEEQESLLENLQAYLERSAAPQAKSLPRVASWKWVCAVDNMISLMTGSDLAQFKLPDYNFKTVVPVKKKDHIPAPVLSVCCDQASSQMTPLWYLGYEKGLALTMLADPAHRQNNDLLAAIRECNLFHIVKAKSVSWNTFFGPWGSGSHWIKTVDAAAERGRRLGSSDPFLQLLLPRIARARMEVEQLDDPAYGDRMADLIQDAVATKKSKYQCSRFLLRGGVRRDKWIVDSPEETAKEDAPNRMESITFA